jgi:hypothetical protein
LFFQEINEENMKDVSRTRVGGWMPTLLATSFTLNFLLITLLQTTYTSAFEVRSSPMSVNHCSGIFGLDRERAGALYMNEISVTDEPPVEIQDKNGKVIEVGYVVRVAVENIKAYQVPAKSFGTFNENKEFVPSPADAPRGTKNLVLPIGLRGVVSKLYDSDDISANFPIQVKFMPGDKGGNTDEGYDPPVALIMHFDPNEIECT